MRRALAVGLCSVLMPLLASCNTTQPPPPQAVTPPPPVYWVEGIAYTSREKALEAHKAMVQRDTAALTPLTQKIPGKLIAVMPSTEMVHQSTYSLAHRQDDATDWLADTVNINYHANVAAIEKAQIFDAVTIVESDAPDSVATDGYAYRLRWDYENTDSKHHWRLEKIGSNTADLVFGKSVNDLERLRVFNIAVINAAADLGVAVERVAMPNQPPGTPGANPPTGLMTGTTFFINANGYSLTNAHVAYGCKSLKVVLPDGEAEATLVNSDVKNDLALLKLTSHAAPAFAQLHSALPRQGEDIVVYGFPLAGALASQGNLTTGIISALSGMQDDSRLLQVSAPIQPGNSGGPLLNDEGQVVGIINSSLNPAFLARITGNLPQNVNFAIKTSIATNFLDSNNIKYENGHARPVMHTADIGDLAKSFTYMVKCQH